VRRKRSCLLYTRKRTCAAQTVMSALGQKRTSRHTALPTMECRSPQSTHLLPFGASIYRRHNLYCGVGSKFHLANARRIHADQPSFVRRFPAFGSSIRGVAPPSRSLRCISSPGTRCHPSIPSALISIPLPGLAAYATCRGMHRARSHHLASCSVSAFWPCTQCALALSSIFFGPLVIVSAPDLFITRRAIAGVVGAVATFALMGVVLSPILMIVGFRSAKPDHVEPLAALASAATETWHERIGGPLLHVAGNPLAANAMSFYSKDRPTVLLPFSQKHSASETAKKWTDSGILVICRQQDARCISLQQWLPTAERVEITLPVSFLWMTRPPQTYVLFLQAGAQTPH